MRILIGACGFSRNTPLAVLYGPTHLGGAGFIKWYTVQGEGQIINFLQHWRTTTEVGLMLRIALYWAQHFAGISQPLLTDHNTNLTYVPSRWIMSLRDFLISINSRLHIYRPLIYPIQRQHDRLIMDVVDSISTFNRDQIESINLCRLYLQISTISDMTNEEGTHLQPAAIHGPPTHFYSTPKWLYPVQNKPSHKVWVHWLRFLDIIAGPSRSLHQSLGEWLASSTHLAREWNELRHKTGQYHYVQQLVDKSKWLQFTRHQKTWQATCITTQLPFDDLFPCRQSMPLQISLSLYPNQTVRTYPATFHEFLEQQTPQVQHFLSVVNLQHDPFTIMNFLQNDDVNYLVTDGSSLPSRIAYGWVLALDDETILAEGQGPAAGNTTSYRAEAYGLHAGLHVLQLLCQYTNSSFAALTILCDNQGIITRAEARHQYDEPFPTSTTNAEWDQLEHAHQIAQQLRLEMSYQHVKGHQDDSDHELDLPAKLNVCADFLAGDFIHSHITSYPHVPVTEICQCHLQIDQHTVTSNYRLAIRDAASAPALRQHIITFCSPGTTQSLIDWNIFSTVNQRMKHLRVWATKFLYNALPTVTYDKTYTFDRPRCSTCPENVDTWLHQLTCPEQSRRQATTTHLLTVRQHLIDINTCPELQQTIMAGLRTFYLHQDPSFGRHLPLFASQEKIGWVHFVKGIWHKDWCLAQDQYLRKVHQYNVKSTGTLWAITDHLHA